MSSTVEPMRCGTALDLIEPLGPADVGANLCLEGIEERFLSGEAELTSADIDANQGTIQNVRLWDHEPLLDTFAQIQEIRTYYDFVSVDNDRYRLDGEMRQIMLSPRELNTESLPRTNLATPFQ